MTSLSNMRMTDYAQMHPIIDPVNLATGANNGDWINVRDYERFTIVVGASVGTAANDITVTINQATDNAGTGAKALNFTRIDSKESVDLADTGQFTEVTQAAANAYTSATNGESDLLYLFEFTHEDLDIVNDFDHITCNINQAGAAKIGYALAICYGPRFGQDPQVSVL